MPKLENIFVSILILVYYYGFVKQYIKNYNWNLVDF